MDGRGAEHISLPDGGMQRISVINDKRLWPENNPGFENDPFQEDNSSQLQENQEILHNTNNNVSHLMESQDIFNDDRLLNGDINMDDNDDNEMDDPIVDPESVMNIEEMGHEFLELQQDLIQKQNDLDMLTNTAVCLRNEVEEKQKRLETSKFELLTEKDNFDNVQKMLDDEIELISTIGNQQEAIKKIMKNFLEQRIKVSQLLTNFDSEFCELKLNSTTILFMFQTRINELKKKLEIISGERSEEKNKKQLVIKEREEIESRLKIAINNMEEMFGKLQVKRYQQTAILEYLKNKGDEEWSKFKEIENEWKSVEQNGLQLIANEENKLFAMENRFKEISDELAEAKNKILTEERDLEYLIHEKNNLNEELQEGRKDEERYLQEILNITNNLSQTENHIETLKETLNVKLLIKDENKELEDHIAELQLKKDEVLKNLKEIIDSIVQLESICLENEQKLQITNEEIQTNSGLQNVLNCKRFVLTEQFEKIKEDYQISVNDLNKQKEHLETMKINIENEIKNLSSEINEKQNSADSQFHENEKMKSDILKNTANITNIEKEITELENNILKINGQFEIDLAQLENEIFEKENIKAAKQAEIESRCELKSQIEELKKEIQLIEEQQKEEIENLEKSQNLELKERQEILEKKKAELASEYKEQKKLVTELQEELIDDQKKELYLVKSIQKLAHIKKQNQQELIDLRNVIKTLDDKLKKLAHTVAQWKSDKESTICTQETVTSGRASAPSNFNTTSSKNVRSNPNDDSSSSGVSVNDIDWKRKLMKKQHQKLTQVTSEKPDQDESAITTFSTQQHLEKPAGHEQAILKDSQDAAADIMTQKRVKRSHTSKKRATLK